MNQNRFLTQVGLFLSLNQQGLRTFINFGCGLISSPDHTLYASFERGSGVFERKRRGQGSHARVRWSCWQLVVWSLAQFCIAGSVHIQRKSLFSLQLGLNMIVAMWLVMAGLSCHKWLRWTVWHCSLSHVSLSLQQRFHSVAGVLLSITGQYSLVNSFSKITM